MLGRTPCLLALSRMGARHSTRLFVWRVRGNARAKPGYLERQRLRPPALDRRHGY